jgi:hypothetical protein
LDQKRVPQTMSPPQLGDIVWGCKVDPKSGPYLAAVNRSLLVQISEDCTCMWQQNSVHMVHMEAGLCRRPYCVYKGSPTKREAR